jgi:formylglycine-generating enzyme required for sulfatase activity
MWTTTIYDQEKYRYPYKADDGREHTEAESVREDEIDGGKSLEAPRRVVRGGGWGYSAVHCRAARRYRFTPGDRDNDIGFRLSILLP